MEHFTYNAKGERIKTETHRIKLAAAHIVILVLYVLFMIGAN